MTNANIQTDKIFFKQDYISEFDAFAKYFAQAQENNYQLIFKIAREFDDFHDSCELFEEIGIDPTRVTHVDMNITTGPVVNPHDKILHASKKVKIAEIPGKGRGLVANEDIGQSEVIISEKATLLQINPICLCTGDDTTSLYRCHNCSKVMLNFIICDNCNIVLFCSLPCYNEAYYTYHKYECLGWQHHFWNCEYLNFSYIAMRMMMYGAQFNFNTCLDYSCYGHEYNNYATMFHMKSHFFDLTLLEINEVLYRVTRTVVYLIEKTNFFQSIARKMRMSLYNSYIYIGGLMVIHYCQAQVNSIIMHFNHPRTGLVINSISGSGKAICPTVSLLNHSCAPNATLIVFNDRVVVKTLEHIKKNEEITVCYHEVCPFFSVNSRITITKYLFYFTCQCVRCESKQLADRGYYKCLKCKHGRAVYKVENKIESMHCVDCKCTLLNTDEVRGASAKYRRVYVLSNVYAATNSVEHLIELHKESEKIYHEDSMVIINGGRILCEKFIKLEVPLEILRFALKTFKIFDRHCPRHYINIMVGKLNVFYKAMTMACDNPMEINTAEDLKVLTDWQAEINKVKNDLLFYLPKRRLFFLEAMMTISKNMLTQKAKIHPRAYAKRLR